MADEIRQSTLKKLWSMVNETEARLWHIVLGVAVMTCVQVYLNSYQKQADVRSAAIVQYVGETEALITDLKSFADAATEHPVKLNDARARLGGTLSLLYSKGFTLEAELSGDDREAVSAYLSALSGLEKILPRINDPEDPQDNIDFFKPVSILIDAQRNMVEELG